MKIPKARRLKSGTWFIQLRINGESISVTASSKKECENKARYIKSEHKIGKRKKFEDMTLGEAVDRYIESRDNVLSPSTIKGYYVIRNNRFQDHMQSSVSDINMQSMINAEIKKASPKTVKNAWGLISSALSYSNFTVPKLSLPAVPKKEKLWLQPEQIPLFLKEAKGNKYEREILLALHGLRLSEISAINLTKIDLANDCINVSGAIVYGVSGLVQKPTNKNKSSQRAVPIMIPRLKELFELGDVTACRQETIYDNINKICRNAGLPEVGTHGLRHSFASLCYHLKLSERETMELGGWSDANTMRKIYIHLAQKDRQKAQNKLKDFYQNANQFAN